MKIRKWSKITITCLLAQHKGKMAPACQQLSSLHRLDLMAKGLKKGLQYPSVPHYSPVEAVKDCSEGRGGAFSAREVLDDKAVLMKNNCL